jgi:hypothetical protein
MTATTTSDGRTPMPGGGGHAVLVGARVERLPSCGCGQALEPGRARSCPRCGVAVSRSRA